MPFSVFGSHSGCGCDTRNISLQVMCALVTESQGPRDWRWSSSQSHSSRWTPSLAQRSFSVVCCKVRVFGSVSARSGITMQVRPLPTSVRMPAWEKYFNISIQFCRGKDRAGGLCKVVTMLLKTTHSKLFRKPAKPSPPCAGVGSGKKVMW